MSSYWALIKDSWYWAKDRKLVIILLLIFVLLLALFVIFVRVVPDPEGLKRRFEFHELTRSGHYYLCRYEKRFNKMSDVRQYVKSISWSYMPCEGALEVTRRDDRTGETVVKSITTDVREDTVEDNMRKILGFAFDDVKSVSFDPQSLTLSYEVTKHVKTLPVRLKTLFFDESFPVPVSASLFTLYIENAIFSLLVGFFGFFFALYMTQKYMGSSLERGTVELWLSKPISRTGFMLSRFIGGNLSLLILALLLVIPFEFGLWVQTGVYTLGFLLVIPVFIFYFSCLYCVVILSSIVLRRGSIYIALLLWVLAKVVYIIKTWAEAGSWEVPDSLKTFANAGYNILPKLPEIGEYSTKMLRIGTNIMESDLNMFLGPASTDVNSVLFVFGTSAAFIAVILGIASWIFSRKSY